MYLIIKATSKNLVCFLTYARSNSGSLLRLSIKATFFRFCKSFAISGLFSTHSFRRKACGCIFLAIPFSIVINFELINKKKLNSAGCHSYFSLRDNFEYLDGLGTKVLIPRNISSKRTNPTFRCHVWTYFPRTCYGEKRLGSCPNMLSIIALVIYRI